MSPISKGPSSPTSPIIVSRAIKDCLSSGKKETKVGRVALKVFDSAKNEKVLDLGVKKSSFGAVMESLESETFQKKLQTFCEELPGNLESLEYPYQVKILTTRGEPLITFRGNLLEIFFKSVTEKV